MSVIHRVLLIEDDAATADSVAYALRNEGYDVQVAGDGSEGLSAFRSMVPDLIILDLILPKLNGLDLCRMIRRESGVPIIMLTAKTDEIDRVLGLEFGADDYVTKPFSVRELIARVKAVLRRSDRTRYEEPQGKLEAGGVTMDVARRRATVDGNEVHLPLKQFELLRVLLMNKGRVVPRQELFRNVWDEDSAYDTGTLDVHIRWLREKVEADPSHPTRILTVRGVGYRIVDDSK